MEICRHTTGRSQFKEKLLQNWNKNKNLKCKILEFESLLEIKYQNCLWPVNNRLIKMIILQKNYEISPFWAPFISKIVNTIFLKGIFFKGINYKKTTSKSDENKRPATGPPMPRLYCKIKF